MEGNVSLRNDIDSPAIGAADPDPPSEVEATFSDLGALPFDGDDPALLYVVPHRAAGGRLELRARLAVTQRKR
jgi:hypothetical protein